MPAGAVDETPVTSVDFYSTFLEMAGAADAAGHTVDGVSLKPLLEQAAPLERERDLLALPALRQRRLHAYGRNPAGRLEADRVLRGRPRRALQPGSKTEAEEQDRAADMPDKAAELRALCWPNGVSPSAPSPRRPTPTTTPTSATERYGIGYKPQWDEADPFRPRH